MDLLCWLRSSASQPVNPVFRLAAGMAQDNFRLQELLGKARIGMEVIGCNL